MFEVLVYLYENYFRPDACPDADTLARKLSAAGFEGEEINDALSWLSGLAQLAQANPPAPARARGAFRIFTDMEYERLGVAKHRFPVLSRVGRRDQCRTAGNHCRACTGD